MTVGVALAAPIGPINIEIIRRGIQGGYLGGWLVGLGALTAGTTYATLIVSGLTPAADRLALRVPLFLAGALVLGWIGGGSVRAALRGDPVVRGVAPLLLGGVFIGILLWVSVLSWLAQVARRFVTGRGMRWVTGIGGLALIGFARWFAWQAIVSLET
jgi:threonine/homoserine/homoserine lactone efflux protein